MSDRDEEIIGVIRRGLNDLSYDRVEDGILNAIRAVGYVVVPGTELANARDEIETVLEAIRGKPPRNKQEVPVRWIANRLKPAFAMLSAHTDTAPDGEVENDLNHTEQCDVMVRIGGRCNCGAETRRIQRQFRKNRSNP